MARPRKRWSQSTGEYGSSLRIWEPRLGSPLRWDWRDEHGRHRPPVESGLRVRRERDSDVDPVAERLANDLLRKKAAELTLSPIRKQETDAHSLTVGQAYEMYFNPRRAAVPTSKSGRAHQEASRELWERELGADRLWNYVPPADVWGVLQRIRDDGKVPTAVKRLQNLRTLTRWLKRRMRIRGLEDPTLGLEVSELKEGYTPRRPRYTPAETAKLRKVWLDADPRFRLLMAIMVASGARVIQARTTMRSGVNAPLEPAVPESKAPHGWLLMAGVKRQRPMLTLMTKRMRHEIDGAIAGYLSDFEERYQDGQINDYPLIPGGRLDSRGEITLTPVTDAAVRTMLHDIEKEAEVEHKKRRAFHGFRRMWVDLIDAEAGLDTAAHAGGWSRREMVEGTYVSKRRFEHLDKAREIMEEAEDGDEGK